MKMLRELSLVPVYDSAEYDLVRDLQVPLLGNSTEYLRGVGFFASGWLRIASRGMATFVERGGKARIVLSPVLQRVDWEALQRGEEAKSDHELKLVLALRVRELSRSLESDTLNSLAWMVADGVLDFRFAVPRILGYPGNYHDKVGLFKDENGDAVVIHGSLNDSVQGSLNGEAFSVFKSWDEGQRLYFEKHESRLLSLWNGENKQFRVREIPDAIRENIVQLRTTTNRPYDLTNKVEAITRPPFTPHCSVKLHPFQEEAIVRWRESGYRGIFEMATGTGKTVTSLAAAVERYRELGKLAVIVAVPYLHLLEQWERNCREFGFAPILCSSKHDNWPIEVKSQTQDLTLGVKSNVCILAVHATAATKRFQTAIARLRSQITMFIGDEAHGLGSAVLRNALTETAGMRLGLSATPRRWYDDQGTEAIYSYFGKTCFEFTLDQAIGKYLTPYDYNPQLVNLTDEEAASYRELTRQAMLLRSNVKGAEAGEKLKKVLLRRARIVSSAQAKVPSMLALMRSLIQENRQNSRETRDILVYCAPGHHREVLREVAGLGLRCHEFVYDVGLREREKLLRHFASGDIQVLVAIKCLDEGVDVPSTRFAFILASSTNPREFVQRRGRILRLVEGKTKAFIYDFIVVPGPAESDQRRDTDISVLRREMPRFVEFSSSALNEFQARSTVRELLNRYETLNLLDEKPWDVYHTLKQWDWEADE